MSFLASTHFHIFTWVIGIILFLAAAVLAKGSKGQKITHMTARLFYILILFSGIMLFIEGMNYDEGALYGVKLLLGLLTIGFMEMILVRSSKEKNVTSLWIFFFIALFATMFLGFKLPIGFTFFM